MDRDAEDSDGPKVRPRVGLDSEKVEIGGEEEEEKEGYNESDKLLPPRKGGMWRRSEKAPRKVQWNDKNGNKLAEVLEFLPSDGSDSDEEESDSCICTIM